MNGETKTILREADRAVKEALEAIGRRRNEEDRKFIIASIGADLARILQPFLIEMANNSRIAKEELREILKEIRVEAPQVNVQPPKVEVNIPEINVPKPDPPDPLEVKVKLPKIPAPQVTVKPAVVKIPKEMKVKGMAQLLKSFTDFLKNQGEKFSQYFDQENPMPVILIDPKSGDYYKAISNIISGGGPAGVVTTRPPLEIALGFEQLAVSNTAIGLASIPEKANKAVMTVEDGTLRYRDDGTAPTATVGLKVFVGGTIILNGRDSIQKFLAIRQGTTDSELNVSYYEVK